MRGEHVGPSGGRKVGGVLVVPGPVPLDEWSIAAARQQKPFRERPVEAPIECELRTRTELGDGMAMQRLLPGDKAD